MSHLLLLLLSNSLMSQFICLYLFLSSPALFHHTQTHSHCFVCPSSPGLLKDLKTMGSISLFIFFITLLVLARQVSPNCESLNYVFCLVLCSLINIAIVLFCFSPCICYLFYYIQNCFLTYSLSLDAMV